ncbi:quinone-dependent dihydroorotate dehydrogenase [Formicincola oecophyllae]|nr:quinone-dependent dihydroorotate dehydrogenase [Formicincola oecophyllae]
MAAWLLRRLGPEDAHEVAMRTLQSGLAGWARPDDPALACDVMGMRCPNPVGLAAGFDKDGRAIRGLARLGFGFIEAGTVTLHPQKGNPSPRLFRLPAERAIINRMGFNGRGAKAFEANMHRLQRHGGSIVPLGINIGLNKEGAHPLQDYPTLINALGPFARYMVINISCPNQQGVRAQQGADTIGAVLAAVRQQCPVHPPLAIKLSPDLSSQDYPPLVEAAARSGASALVLTNTTTTRPGVGSPLASEVGGLSGRPLAQRAREVLRTVAACNEGRLVLISTGGIESGRDVFERLCMGADLVQIYSSFIYDGPSVISRIKRELLEAMRSHGLESIRQLRSERAEGRLRAHAC